MVRSDRDVPAIPMFVETAETPITAQLTGHLAPAHEHKKCEVSCTKWEQQCRRKHLDFNVQHKSLKKEHVMLHKLKSQDRKRAYAVSIIHHCKERNNEAYSMTQQFGSSIANCSKCEMERKQQSKGYINKQIKH